MQRQVHLLRQFGKHANLLIGRVAMVFLPGHGQKFSGPRRINGQRPVCVTLEVTPEGGLTLSGAIARQDSGKMRYRVIFRYDLTQIMRKGASGAALDSGRNPPLANVACDLLQELIRFAERNLTQLSEEALTAEEVAWPRLLVAVPRDESVFEPAAVEAAAHAASLPGGLEAAVASVKLSATVHAGGVHLVDAQFVKSGFVLAALKSEAAYEDFEPVLRAGYWNPARLVAFAANPARTILDARGLRPDWHTTAEDALIAELIGEMREKLPLADRYTDDELITGLIRPDKPVPCAVTLGQFAAQETTVDPVTFAEYNPRQMVIDTLRKALKRSVSGQATDEDILAAAANPKAPLYLTRRCTTQIVMNEQLSQLPANYVGEVLPRPDWVPPSVVARAAKHSVTSTALITIDAAPEPQPSESMPAEAEAEVEVAIEG